MKLSRAAALGVFAATHVAEHQETDGPVRSQDIALALGIPAEYLVKILQQLVRARIMDSTRGPKGGFMLCIPPSRVTLRALIEAVDGPIDGLVPVVGDIQGKARAKQRVEQACGRAAGNARSVMEKTTLGDLVAPRGRNARRGSRAR